MKKAVLIPIIVASSLLLVGGVFVGVSIAVANKTNGYEVNEVVLNESFSNLDFDLSTSDLEFKASTDGAKKVILQERSKLRHEVKVEDNKLIVKKTDTREWYEKAFSFSTSYLKVTVFLPSNTYGDLYIHSSTGDISVPKEFTFNNVKVDLSTGNTRIASKVGNTIDVESSTGDITVEGIQPNNAYMKASTGKVTLNSVVAKENIKVNTSTGDITLNSCDAPSIDVEASTGEVNMSLLSGKIFDITTNTGKKNVPVSTLGGTCKVKTSTGDINISVL